MTQAQSFSSGTILKHTRESNGVEFPKAPLFHALLKTQKFLACLSVRPVVLGNGIMEKFSKVVDLHPRPHMLSLSSYTKDTIYFLQYIDELSIPSGAWLVAVDVEVLFIAAYNTRRARTFLQQRCQE